MKRCTHCGREYDDQLMACPQDGKSLFPTAQLDGPENRFAIASAALGTLLASLILASCVYPGGWGVVVFFTIFLGPVLGIAAIVCGHIARAQIKRTPGKYGDRGAAISGLVTGYIGTILTGSSLLGLILHPIHAKDAQANCRANLKQISLAIYIWSGDNNDVLPVNFLEMTNELNDQRVLVCPADPLHTEPSGWTKYNWYELPLYTGIKWDPTNISYELLLPGAALNNVSNQAVVRCPIHGFEILGDGNLRDGAVKR